MNKEQAYDEKIAPLMNQIIEACKEHGIAMLATFAIPTPEDDGLHCSTCLADESDQLPDNIAAAKAALFATRPRTTLTTRNAQGEVVNQTVIL